MDRTRKMVTSITTCVLTIGLALSATGCTKDPDSPKEQRSRELKAAGVRTFVIECSADLWERTNGSTTVRDTDDTEAMKVAKGASNTVTVTLSGPEMVKYLRTLDYAAHGGDYGGGPTTMIDAALATRLYDAIAPVVDSVSKTPDPDQEPPVITVDDKPNQARSAP